MKLHPTQNSIGESQRSKIVDLLNQQLANLSDLYSQAKQAHWNVRGRLFHNNHKLFDQVAEAVQEHIDKLAERITALGGTALGTVRMAGKFSELPEYPEVVPNEDAHLTCLVDRFSKAAYSAREAAGETNSLNDLVTSDMLVEVLENLDKSLWMLEASLQR